jgi:hypothetical protein
MTVYAICIGCQGVGADFRVGVSIPQQWGLDRAGQGRKKTPVRAGVGGQTRHKTGGCRVNVPGLYPRYFEP